MGGGGGVNGFGDGDCLGRRGGLGGGGGFGVRGLGMGIVWGGGEDWEEGGGVCVCV